ncbi:hypothetical protein F5884DRAFT_757569 [Xylogone sp. PMI_703]|nr:hypothetical protein F5884DRAFT_757569 [Xylogone sp. PMI_703]
MRGGIQTRDRHTQPPVQPQRLPVSQLPPDRSCQQTNYTFSQQNNSDLEKLLCNVNERFDALEHSLEQLRLMVAEHLGRIDGTMKRFEVMGKGVLDLALQGPQTEQLSHASQDQNPDKSYYEETGIDQASTSIAPQLNSSQTLYPSQSSQEQYLDYDIMGLLGNNIT